VSGNSEESVTPLLVTVLRACALLSLSRVSVYELLRRGDLQSKKVGRRRLITYESISRFASSPAASKEVARESRAYGRPKC
jgi:excisionase family DNA binding protein